MLTSQRKDIFLRFRCRGSEKGNSLRGHDDALYNRVSGILTWIVARALLYVPSVLSAFSVADEVNWLYKTTICRARSSVRDAYAKRHDL